MNKIDRYLKLRGKELKENQREADEIYNVDKIIGRRKEVERMIEIIEMERLETQRKRVEENNAFDQLNLNDAKARVDELEKLLKEVQQEQ